MRKSGCEIVAHNARVDYKNGKHILTIDKKNAFNCPDRRKIAEELYNRQEFSHLYNLFMLEY
jgi:hypothetical protein